jgi:hypothetical protein
LNVQYDKLEAEFNEMKAVNKKKAAELEKSIETRVEAIKKEFENKERCSSLASRLYLFKGIAAQHFEICFLVRLDRFHIALPLRSVFVSVAEPHHFYAALAPGKSFDAALAPAPTLLYSKAKFLK